MLLDLNEDGFDFGLDGTEPAFYWHAAAIELAGISDEFLEAVKAMCSRLGFDHRWLLAVMDHESNIRPDIQNKSSNATGLIQFLPSTAKSLGTTVDALKVMTPVQQLVWVEKYLKQWGPLRTATDVAASVFYPKARGNAGLVIGTRGSKAYEWNKSLDKEEKGFITMVDYMRSLWKFGKRWGVEMSDVDGYLNAARGAKTLGDLNVLSENIQLENPKSVEATSAFSAFKNTINKIAQKAGSLSEKPVYDGVDYRDLAVSKIRGAFKVQSDYSPTLKDYGQAIAQTAVDLKDKTVETVEKASNFAGPVGFVVVAGGLVALWLRLRGK